MSVDEVAAALSAFVDHPLVLAIAVVLSVPLVWHIGRSWFANIEEDAKDAVVPAVIDEVGGPLIPTWLLLKVVWFSIVSAAIVITFYKVGSWIAN